MRTYAAILGCLFFIAASGQPPHLRFQTYNAEDGLSQSVVQKIHQCRKGFLWFATQDGLNRFDGYRFKVFRKGADTTSLPWNNILDIAEDSAGGLWLATAARGLCRLQPDSGTVRRLPRNPPLVSNSLSSLTLDGKNLWVSTSKGASLVDVAQNRLQHNFSCSGKAIEKIIVQSPARAWAFAHDGHLFLLDAHRPDALAAYAPKKLFGSDTIEVWDVVTHNNAIYVCTSQGLFTALLSAVAQQSFKRVPIITTNGTDYSRHDVYSFFIDRKGQAWVGLDALGILMRPDSTQAFSAWKRDFVHPWSLPDNFVKQIFEDRDGTTWFATEKGIARLLPQQSFLYTVGQEVDPTSDRLGRLFALGQVDEQHLLVGRISQACVYNLKTGALQEVFNQSGINPQRFYFFQPWGLNHFLTGYQYGIGMVERKGNDYFFRKADEYPELNAIQHRATTVLRVNDSVSLIGTLSDGGLWRWNHKAHSLHRYTQSANGLISNQINRIFPDEKGGYWLATDKGVSLFHAAEERFTNYPFSNRTGEAAFINDLFFDGTYLWLAVYSQGLARWRPGTTDWKLWGVSDGLSNNMVYNLRPDASGNIWLSSNAGLSVFIQAKQQFINYSAKDGLQDNEFNRFCVLETDQHIFFGGISGFTCVARNNPNLLQPAPRVLITDVEYHANGGYKSYPFQQQTHVRLRHAENDLSIRYAALLFNASHRMQYTYMLEGYDKSWIQNNGATEVAYTNLAPGNYKFLVKVVNPEFTTEQTMAILPIRIMPAWYQTLVFKLLVIALCTALIFFVVRWYYQARLRRKTAEYEKLLAVQAERQRISTEIHDDVGAGLSGIRLLTEVTRTKIPEGALQEDVNKIYRSVTDLSTKMREVIWRLNTENDSLENLLFYLQRQAVALFEHSNVHLTVLVPVGHIPYKELDGEQRRHIYLCVKEALHNVLKHSAADNCLLKMEVEPQCFCINVSDDGRLWNGNGNTYGQGLRSMQQRMAAVGGMFQLKIENGTHIIFTIPLHES